MLGENVEVLNFVSSDYSRSLLFTKIYFNNSLLFFSASDPVPTVMSTKLVESCKGLLQIMVTAMGAVTAVKRPVTPWNSLPP